MYQYVKFSLMSGEMWCGPQCVLKYMWLDYVHLHMCMCFSFILDYQKVKEKTFLTNTFLMHFLYTIIVPT